MERSLVFPDAGDCLKAVEETETGELDGVNDVCDVCDAEFGDHGAADVVFCIVDEFVDEDVIVYSVTDDTSDDADGKGEGGDGGDEVVGADDRCDDRGRDDDAANAEACKDEEAPELMKVIYVCHG